MQWKNFAFVAVLAIGASVSSANLVADPGFEGIGASLGSGSPFPPYPTMNNGWSASATDGEVFATALGRPSHAGTYYADLLQNGGANQNTFWDENSSSFVGYDRIVTLVPVSPSTTYDISFFHAGGDRFGYVSFTTLVQVQSMQTAAESSFQFATPALYQWTPASLSFTTDASTTQLALQFSPMGSGNASTLIDDVGVMVAPEPTSLALAGMAGALMLHRRRRV